MVAPHRLLIASLYLALFFSLAPLKCIASDYGPTPVEADTRSDGALLRAVQGEMLIGSWYSFNEGMAPIVISKTHISWPGCKTRYSIVERSVGKSYPHKQSSFETGKTDAAAGRFVTVKLKLNRAECMGGNTLGYLQFSFLTTGTNYSFASVVQYDVGNRPNAWYDLQKH